ncbi:hypothetical protein DXT99_04510 [Pontibacter diazotrophicus]|uniref:DUF349 domain-containing protein n=1 Tax=Pontibacter diazotrophicus TaxID=1400979 RepID=A0A3D8LGE6_9BACT|nr:hypothetical protein [Pontibacter diazotrophicus]RDV16468.1 hypothetical protein DXT99_04510 [Pontibacter diazotrophicus]
MKREITIYSILMLFISVVAISSCTITREQEIEDELGEFRTWLSQETSQLASRTEEDWERTKQDFRMRTQELDQKEDEFTEELRAEYQQLKQEFSEAEESYVGVRSEARKAEWERNLLGSWADMSTIDATNIRDVYITFMENVREQRENWTDADWEMAKLVMEELNERKSEIDANIDTETEVKIKALQMEFHALETAADVTGD